MIIFTGFLVFIGCMSLALSQHRHWKIVTGTMLVARTKKAIRVIGWALLGVALLVCIEAEGLGFAVLIWPLLIAAGSFIVAMLLSFRPGLLRLVARVYSIF